MYQAVSELQVSHFGRRTRKLRFHFLPSCDSRCILSYFANKMAAEHQSLTYHGRTKMTIAVESVHLNGLVVLVPDIFEDARGFFSETFRKDQFSSHGLPVDFVQDNHSGSIKNVVRGLHFQWEPAMGKLMRVTQGSAFLVAVDIRKGSPTLGQWYSVEASAKNRKQVWAPAGFARGFCVLSDWAEIQYKCTGIYNSRAEGGILWNDPEIGIDWPTREPIISEKDNKAQTLAQWLKTPQSDNFRFGVDL